MDERLANMVGEAMGAAAFRYAERTDLDPQVYSLGLWYASGRAVVVSFDETLTSVRVTDAGGAFAELFHAGLLRAKSTEKQTDAFERLCVERGLAWDRASREVVGHAFPGRASFVADLRDVVMRVALASVALAGASVWLGPRTVPRRTKAEMVDAIERFAGRVYRQRRLLAPMREPVRGVRAAWDVDLQMRSDGTVVGCYVASHESLKVDFQLAAGFLADVPSAKGVVLVSDDAPRLLAQMPGLAIVRPDHHVGQNAYRAAVGLVLAA